MSLALLCPGQGAQHAAMFDRVRDLPAVRDVLETASAVLGRDVFAAAADESRFDNVLAQPLLCAASLAHWQGLREAVPAPVLVAGYSIGELAAHAIAGSFDAATCLALAAQRAQLMDSASPADAGLQAVLGLERHVLQPLCDLHGAHVAIANGQDHFIVGGTHASLQRLDDAARARARTSVCCRCACPHTHHCWRRRSHRSLPHSMHRHCRPHACRCWPASMRDRCGTAQRQSTRCRCNWRRPSNGRR